MAWWKFGRKEKVKSNLSPPVVTGEPIVSDSPPKEDRLDCIEAKLDRCLKGLKKIGGRA